MTNGAPARIVVDPTDEIGQIDPNIYGHFLESGFFNNIEGGVFDEGSPLSVAEPGLLKGMRQDVIDACRALDMPVVRWPGGNFTSPYAWTDGIGPRDERPRRLNLAWGGEETNRFGTDEFLAWCEAAGTEPYLAHSARSVDDAVAWVEYTNYAGDTARTRERARNGRPEPRRVRYWGVGNEVYGPWQMGCRPAEQYARDAREHALFMRRVDPAIRIIAVGHDDETWTRSVLEHAGSTIDYLSYHLYGASTHLFDGRDAAEEFAAITAQSVHFEHQIRAYADLVGTLASEAGVDRPIALAIDEWNLRHLEPTSWSAPVPGDDGGIAARDNAAVDPATPGRLRVNRYSPRTLADALFYAGVLHGFQRMSGLAVAPTMANTVNLVNANGLLAVRPGGLVRSATYHVWDLLQRPCGNVAVRAETMCGEELRAIRSAPHPPPGEDAFPTWTAPVPVLDASATVDRARRTLHLSVINRDPYNAIPADIARRDDGGSLPRTARLWQLGGDVDAGDLFAHNLIPEPDRLGVRDLGHVELPDGRVTFPPHSITVCEFPLG